MRTAVGGHGSRSRGRPRRGRTEPDVVTMVRPVSFNVSGKRVHPTVGDERMLLWVLRSDLGLTATKLGCGEPPIVRMSSVIANVIHGATGAPLCQFPATQERLESALNGWSATSRAAASRLAQGRSPLLSCRELGFAWAQNDYRHDLLTGQGHPSV